MQNPNFLILDEPTNDLDIATLNILEDYLQNFKGCVIVVSHDRYFMDKVVDHLFVFEGDTVIRDFPGNYSQYRESLDLEIKQKEPEKKQEQKIKSQDSHAKKEATRKMTFNEKKEFETLEKEIPKLGEEKEKLENQLSSGEIKNSDEITKISKRFTEISNLLDEKEMRWLELSEIG
jgi:ATP-binding cassette subfamily F protein uup